MTKQESRQKDVLLLDMSFPSFIAIKKKESSVQGKFVVRFILFFFHWKPNNVSIMTFLSLHAIEFE